MKTVIDLNPDEIKAIAQEVARELRRLDSADKDAAWASQDIEKLKRQRTAQMRRSK